MLQSSVIMFDDNKVKYNFIWGTKKCMQSNNNNNINQFNDF